MSVQFGSYSMFTEKKHEQDWYEWCVFVDGDRESVNRIQAVEYILHPTFPDPIRRLTEKKNRFALFSSGWGGFLMKTRIIFDDGSEEPSSYLLSLGKSSWPRGPVGSVFDDTAEASAYQVLME